MAGPREMRARPPFAARVLTQFHSPENVAYLRGALTPWGDDDEDAVYTFEACARATLADDPAARRGARPPGDATVGPMAGAAAAGTHFWAEVRRLNRAFVDTRRRTRAAGAGGAEPYHVRAFIGDSLRPPGLEHLNGPGPLYAIREDRVGEGFIPPRDGAPPRSRFAPGSSAARRFMRYTSTPFWQKSGERHYETDIDETLGLGARELPGILYAQLSL